MQTQIPRGQSLSFESNRPFIYYYSVAKPLPEDIAQDLILCSCIRGSLMHNLPKIWFIMAGSTAFMVVEKQQKFVTSNFMLDMFIFSWISGGSNNLKFQVAQKLAKLTVEKEKLERLLDIFQSEIEQIVAEIYKQKHSAPKLAYDNTCVQPLIIFREKGKNDTSTMIKRIEELNVDDDRNDSTLSSSQISQTPSLQEPDRSKSDVRDVTATLQLNKMKKFTKQMEKMTDSIFEQLILFNCENEQWQIARQFVVIILEMSVKSEHYMKTTEKVRFIQPATLFYKKALSVWMLVRSSSQNKITFNQFLCKAKNFLDNHWNDKLVIPLHTVFQIAETLYTEVQNEQDPIEKFVLLLRGRLTSEWEQNLSICTKCLIQQ